MMSNRENIFRDLIEQYKASIWRVCYAYLPDKSFAEDVYQDILIEIWKSMDQFRGQSGWHTYIYRIAVNTAISHGRRETRRPVDFTEKPADIADSSPAESAETESQFQNLQRCIGTLNEQDRLVVTLLLEELTYAEISEITGLSAGNVGVRINRIKQKLHGCITSGI